MNKNVSRVQFIDITRACSHLVDGELWRFREGTQLALGFVNALDAAEPVVTATVALSLINVGKAEASATTDLED